MVRRALAVLCFGLMTMFLTSCGQTYHLESITVSPTSLSLEGISTSQPLTVTANYSNTKTEDVTTRAAYQMSQATATGPNADPNTPNNGASVNNSGIVATSPTVGACTWLTTLNPDGKTYTYSITSPYVVTITYQGFTTTADVYVDSLASCNDPLKPAPPPT